MCLMPVIWLLLRAFEISNFSLGANPIEELLHDLGRWGLKFLLITLAITPMRRWTGWNWLLRFRRMLGLFAFFYILLPQAKNGVLTAASLAWARALGEFGPILIFSGATRMRTEVLPTTVFLEMSVGNIEAAVAVSLIMILSGFAVLMIVRLFGDKKTIL